MTTTLYGWGAMFGLPGPSPFVMKSDIQLQMFKIPFERAIADLDSVSKHKAPYVWDDGTLIEDSTFIRWHFEKKLGVDLDEGLNAEQRANSWTLERMMEHRLSPIMACERWMIDENFARGPRQFFQRVPEAMREKVIAQVRADVAKAMHGGGFSRFSREERMRLASADLAAAAAILGDKPYFFGDHPTGADGACFGVIASCATPFFDSPMPGIVAKHQNLVGYLARMNERFFLTDLWPKMGGWGDFARTHVAAKNMFGDVRRVRLGVTPVKKTDVTTALAQILQPSATTITAFAARAAEPSARLEFNTRPVGLSMKFREWLFALADEAVSLSCGQQVSGSCWSYCRRIYDAYRIDANDPLLPAGAYLSDVLPVLETLVEFRP